MALATLPAFAADTTSTAKEQQVQSQSPYPYNGYYGRRGGGYGMGPGMMGGYGGGYGMGPGMMGGYGGGYGMGPGMMGGYGSGYGMGPGMMGGGYGGMGGYGMGPGMMGGWAPGYLDLTEEQQAKVAKIQDETRKKHWELAGKINDEQARLRELYAAPKTDEAAISKTYKNIGQLQQQMYESSVDAQKRMDAILTPDQREKMRHYWRRAW
jgi:Spy/CpxP family protein refolding chaperone